MTDHSSRPREPSGVFAVPRRTWVTAMSVTALGLGLRLATAPYLSYHGDEAWTLKWAHRSTVDIMTHFEVGLSMHLYILALKPWLAALGEAPWVAKLPSLVAGALTVPLVFCFVRRWFDERTATLAALLCAAHPMLIEFSRFARVYALLVPVGLWSIDAYLCALRSGTRRDLVRLGALNLLAVALSPIAASLP